METEGGAKKMNDFICSRQANLAADHQPLIEISNKYLGIATPKLQRVFSSLVKSDYRSTYALEYTLSIASNPPASRRRITTMAS